MKMRFILGRLSWLLLLLIPSSAIAFPWSVFNPPAVAQGTDASIILLGQLFGSVDGVLHGFGSEVVGAMFYIYNAAVMSLGGVFVIYTITVSTLNTAHQGEFLGKKWNSMFVPFRSAVGVFLLFPKASGYSMIQIFIMWVTLQGVAAGDAVWDAAVSYVKATGTILPTSTNYGNLNTANTGLIPNALNILNNEVCMYRVQKVFNDSHQQNFQSVYFYPADTTNASGATSSTIGSIDFPGQASLDPNLGFYQPAFCGRVKWKVIMKPNPDGTPSSEIDQAATSASRAAVWQMVMSLQPIAQQIANNKDINGNDTLPTDCKNTNPPQCLSGNSLLSASGACPPITCLPVQPLQNSTIDFINSLKTTMVMMYNQQVNQINSQLDSSTKQGWILAGSFYSKLAAFGQDTSDPTKYSPCPTDPNSLTGGCNNVPSGALPPARPTALPESISNSDWNNKIAPYMQYVLPVTGNTSATGSFMDATVNNNIVGGTNKASFTNVDFAQSGSAVGAEVLVGMVTGGLTSVVWAFVSSMQSNGDPIMAVMSLGQALITASVVAWLVIFVVIMALAIPSGICTSMSPLYWMLQAFLLWYIPLAVAIIGAMFTAGCVMAFYVPLVPYILFLFGGMGWFLAVIESMVAGPLVALGILHPEGQHEIVGRAEPAIMLLINLFLRPSLMVMGFIGGILLSYVGMRLLNYGFEQAVDSMGLTGGWGSGMAVLFSVFALVIIYTVIVMMLINKAFSLISEMPGRVMHWLSGGEQPLGDASVDMQQIKGAVSSGASTYAQGQTSGADSLAGQAARSKKPKDKGATPEAKGDPGGGGGEGGGAAGAV